MAAILSLMLVLAARMCSDTIGAQPLNDLSMGLSIGPAETSQASSAKQLLASKTMEQIMSDDYSGDFMPSITTLNHIAASLESFVKGEGLTDQVSSSQANLISQWAASKGGSSASSKLTELDYVTATFWSKFKPLIESLVTQRPDNLTPNDLDFRCKRTEELKELKSMASMSSLYSMYLDTFFSDLHLHCLLRKLALIKNNHVTPPPLVRQFVDIYLDLPSMDPVKAMSEETQEQVAHQLMTGHAFNFKLENAMARNGPLRSAASLVFDPRTALSLTPDGANIEKLVNEFLADCASYNARLGQIWGNFDELGAALSSQTCNLVDLSEKVKLAAPQLVYGTICGQLSRLPR